MHPPHYFISRGDASLCGSLVIEIIYTRTISTYCCSCQLNCCGIVIVVVSAVHSPPIEDRAHQSTMTMTSYYP